MLSELFNKDQVETISLQVKQRSIANEDKEQQIGLILELHSTGNVDRQCEIAFRPFFDLLCRYELALHEKTLLRFRNMYALFEKNESGLEFAMRIDFVKVV